MIRLATTTMHKRVEPMMAGVNIPLVHIAAATAPAATAQAVTAAGLNAAARSPPPSR